MHELAGAAPVDVAGERLWLLPQRAVWWPAARTLMVADVHLGKDAAFRAHGIAVPRGSTSADLARLTTLIQSLNPARLVVLGDLLHDRTVHTCIDAPAVAAWRTRHPDLECLLVRGNHDRHAGEPAQTWRFSVVDEPWRIGPFACHHEPPAAGDGYVLCGHVHPGIRLTGKGRQRARLPCFLVGPGRMVLPAFGLFTGLADDAASDDDGIYVVADTAVVAVHAGGREPVYPIK